MAPRKNTSQFAQDVDSEWDGDNTLAITQQVKLRIDEHKEKRHSARQQIRKRYDGKVEQITTKFHKRIQDEQRRVSKTRAGQLDRLIKAVKARDAKHQAIRDRIGRLYDDTLKVRDMLVAVYEGRQEAASTPSPELKSLVNDKSKNGA